MRQPDGTAYKLPRTVNWHPSIVQARLGHATVAITLDLYTAFIPALDDALADKFSLGLNVDLS